MAENNSLLGLKIMDVLRKHSDKDNPLTQQDIVRLLKSDFGTEVDRKTVGRNIAVLVDYDDDRHIGYKTSKRVQNGEESETRTAFYYKSDFEAGEMRVLIDSILSNRHISMKYTKDLIDKIVEKNEWLRKKGIRDIAFYDTYYKQNIPDLFLNTEEILFAIEKYHDLLITVGEYDVNLNLTEGRRIRVSPIQLCMYEQIYYLIAVPHFDLAFSRKSGCKPSVRAYPIADMTQVIALNHTNNSSIEELNEIRRETDFSDLIEGSLYTARGAYSGEKRSITFVIPIVFLKDVVRRFEKNIRVTEIPGTSWSEHLAFSRKGPLVKVTVNKTTVRAMERFMNEHRTHIYILDPENLNYNPYDEEKRRIFEETVKKVIPDSERQAARPIRHRGVMIERMREVEASGLSDEDKKQLKELLRKMFHSGINMKEYLEKEQQQRQERRNNNRNR